MGIDTWPRVKLAEICDSIDYGYTAAASNSSNGPKFLRITDIFEGYIDWTNVPFCEIEQSVIEKYLLNSGDIVIARTGATTGFSAYISKPPRAVFASYLVRLKVGSTTNARFISYFLKSPLFWEYIRGVLGDKSAQPNASAKTLTQVSLLLPPLPEQGAIAHILGTLDDKIELNRQMNQTMEAMAQALFKSWFVDFEPFREQGMQDSPMGHIPDRWRVGTFGDIITWKRERIGQRQAVILSAVSTGNLLPSDEHFTKRVYSKSTNKYLCVEQWDFAYNPSRINIGSIGMLEDAIFGAVSPVYVVFRPQNDYRWFVNFSLHQKSVKEWINTLASGSVRQSLSFKDFASIPCIIPEVKTVRSFVALWDILLSKIKKNEETSVTLTTIKEMLLPKLLSGDIRVKDAEKFVDIVA